MSTRSFRPFRGYNGAFNDGITPQISWTKARENGWQGTVLSQFFSANGPGPTLNWPGCNIPAQTDASAAAIKNLPFRETLVTDSAFLNVPIGRIGGRIRTIGLCNDRHP